MVDVERDGGKRGGGVVVNFFVAGRNWRGGEKGSCAYRNRWESDTIMLLLTEIPRAVARLLKAQAFFRVPREINVVALCEKDIISLVTAHMDALGMSVTVQVTGCKPDGQAVPGCVRLGNISVVVSVRESIEVNRSDHQGTGLAAEAVIEAVIAHLSGQPLTTLAGAALNVGSMIFDGAQQEEDEEGLYAWSAMFHCSGLLKSEDMTQSGSQEPEVRLP